MSAIRECEERVIEAAGEWMATYNYDSPPRDKSDYGAWNGLRKALRALDAALRDAPKEEDSFGDRVRAITEDYFEKAWTRFDGRCRRLDDEIVRLEKRIESILTKMHGDGGVWSHLAALAARAFQIEQDAASTRSRLAALESAQKADSELWHEHEEKIAALESESTPTCPFCSKPLGNPSEHVCGVGGTLNTPSTPSAPPPAQGESEIARSEWIGNSWAVIDGPTPGDEQGQMTRRGFMRAVGKCESAAREATIRKVLDLAPMQDPHECSSCDLSDEERARIAVLATRLNHIRQAIRAMLSQRADGKDPRA